VPHFSTNGLLNQLAELKHHFGARHPAKIAAVIRRLGQQHFNHGESLIRYHEILLFLRAYPQSPAIVRATEAQLRTFPERVARLSDHGRDLSALADPEVSGVAGTPVTDTFSFDIVRWLVKRYPTRSVFYWDWFEDENRLAETWPRFMPLMEEDALVEANVPYVEWLRAARDGRRELPWVVDRFAQLPLSAKEKAELYNSQKLYVRWSPPYRATRTGLRLPVRKIFYHQARPIQRRDMSFREELENAPSSLQKLGANRGSAALDMAREASTIRYRELYGFTHGDPKLVFKTTLGRGVDLLLVGLPPERRLPLRAYHAAMIYKNGVPVGYFEGLSLFERMESGFNFYYTFREGETAWIYARTLNVFRHLLGVITFTLDPYQIGYENEEGIESGAFWFYRKLGFRPAKAALLKLTKQEEQRISGRKSYRTPATTLRKLAAGPMIFELHQKQGGDWDQFHIRKVGLAVQRWMATKFRGDAQKLRRAAAKTIARALGMKTTAWNKTQLNVFSDFSVVLSLIPDLNEWSLVEKREVVRVIQAKASSDESKYLKLMQQHDRLRAEIIRLGSLL
jgi:hypothetical protein